MPTLFDLAIIIAYCTGALSTVLALKKRPWSMFALQAVGVTIIVALHHYS